MPLRGRPSQSTLAYHNRPRSNRHNMNHYRLLANLLSKYGYRAAKSGYASYTEYMAGQKKKSASRATVYKKNPRHKGYRGGGMNPRTYLQRPLKGSNKSANGRLFTKSSSKHRSRGLLKKFPQKVSTTYYYTQKKSLITTGVNEGTIRKLEPIVTLSSNDLDRQTCILHNLTFNCWNRNYKIGNQTVQPPYQQDGGYPIYCTTSTGTNIQNGLWDYSSPVVPIITQRNMPRSANISSKPYQIPTHVFESANINLQFQNISSQAQRVSLKIVKYNGDTLPFNPKMEDFGTGVNLNFPITQKMLNHWAVTDSNEFTTIWSTTRVMKGLCPNKKQTTHSIKKKVHFMYKRSTCHKHQQATEQPELGMMARPQFEETNESWNTCFLVISTNVMDDVVVKFQTDAKAGQNPGDWSSKDTPIITDVAGTSNRIFIKGTVTTNFRVKDIYSRTEVETLNTAARLDLLENDTTNSDNLIGDWTSTSEALAFTLAANPNSAVDGNPYTVNVTAGNLPNTTLASVSNNELILHSDAATYRASHFKIVDDETISSGNSTWTKS